MALLVQGLEFLEDEIRMLHITLVQLEMNIDLFLGKSLELGEIERARTIGINHRDKDKGYRESIANDRVICS